MKLFTQEELKLKIAGVKYEVYISKSNRKVSRRV